MFAEFMFHSYITHIVIFYVFKHVCVCDYNDVKPRAFPTFRRARIFSALERGEVGSFRRESAPETFPHKTINFSQRVFENSFLYGSEISVVKRAMYGTNLFKRRLEVKNLSGIRLIEEVFVVLLNSFWYPKLAMSEIGAHGVGGQLFAGFLQRGSAEYRLKRKEGASHQQKEDWRSLQRYKQGRERQEC